MNLVDANVLLYAVNESSDRHQSSREWLDGSLNGSGAVGFAWVALLAFVRLSTKIGLFPTPLPVPAALETVRAWLEQPVSVVLEPAPRHLSILTGLLTGTGTGGNLANDAHLAALGIEHRATIVTYDGDFGRFPGVKMATPESLLSL